MAELVLSRAGALLGSRIAPQAFRSLGAALGRTAGSAIGARIDGALFGETRRLEGPRLSEGGLQTSTEGASIPLIYGRARVSGEVFWAARFKEHVVTERVSAGKGQSVKSTRYQYTASFAIGLCEGEIARIGRVWANGEILDMSRIAHRVHVGSETQTADPLIEAIEGIENTPAYLGLAYIVFEDFPIDEFGNVIPQLSFEVIKPTAGVAARLETMARAVCLIPGTGEFAYGVTPVRRVIAAGEEASENAHVDSARSDFSAALDHLQADLPNVASVMLIVSWFGNDLRCGSCLIRPGVDRASKVTRPVSWRVGPVTRGEAYVVSTVEGAAAFGGTPSDVSVIEAITELRRRGLRVVLCPFLLMDIPADNTLPDPYGATAQSAYPWRGRITCFPGPQQSGAVDKTAAAATQVAAFFGGATADHFTHGDNEIGYNGPAEWSFRRFVLHYAEVAKAAGGVDVFVLGSELRGVTSLRSSASAFPAVSQLCSLAAEVRAKLGPGVKVTYGADWSEYQGYQPQDGSQDVFFHLDPLWADANIDAIGVDWYPPLSDWREGFTHLDAGVSESIYDLEYLRGRIESAENYDWYYANETARAAQVRTAIADSAYDKPWVFRAKDLRRFWSEPHFNRPGGVESISPTAWIPGSKPIWLLELGCPAVDKGANQPNVFFDPKSSESALPYNSNGARDDLIQRRCLEAYLGYWDETDARNPPATLYSGRMIDPAMTHLWAWDARPHPQFPALSAIWADGAQWRVGHWLNGRAGLSGLGEVCRDLCARAGLVDVDVSGLAGIVSGYVVDAPTTARIALAPLLSLYGADLRERDGRLVLAMQSTDVAMTVALADLIEAEAPRFAVRGDIAALPLEARVRFIDGERDYRLGVAAAQRRDSAREHVIWLDAPLVLDETQARDIAQRALLEARAALEGLELHLGPQALALEPGDLIALEGHEGAYRITRIEEDMTRRIKAQRDSETRAPNLSGSMNGVAEAIGVAPQPLAMVLDLGPLPGQENDERPLVGVFAKPWRGAHDIFVGADVATASLRGAADAPANLGTLAWDLYPGPLGRWDDGNVTRINWRGVALSSVDKNALLAGENMFAVERPEGGFEVIQAREILLVGPQTYELRGLLRGLIGSEPANAQPAVAGAAIIKVDGALTRMAMLDYERGANVTLVAPPAGEAKISVDAKIGNFTFTDNWARPFAPAHLRARRDSDGAIAVTWVRRARMGGDSWASGDVGLGEESEHYRLEILSDGAVKRTVEVLSPAYIYPVSDQIADFGSPISVLGVRVMQMSLRYGAGRMKESVFTL